MNWNQQDNKKYRGKIDRVFVSMTEYYEVDFFVEQYLKKNNYAVTDANRDIIHAHMETYPGRAPIQRVALEQWIDERIAQAKR